MTEKPIPKIRVGDMWVPAHRVWRVVETITTAADLVERFNADNGELTTPITRDVVSQVRERIRAMELSMGGEGALQAAAAEAAALEAEQAGGHGDNDLDPAAAGGHGSTEVVGHDDAQRRRLSQEALADAARQLLEAMPLEDALRMLESDYQENVGVRDLIKMVGQETYLATLGREAAELQAHQIAPDQIALLWNESGFPSPVDGQWSTEDVQALLED